MRSENLNSCVRACACFRSNRGSWFSKNPVLHLLFLALLNRTSSDRFSCIFEDDGFRKKIFGSSGTFIFDSRTLAGKGNKDRAHCYTNAPTNINNSGWEANEELVLGPSLTMDCQIEG